MKLTQDQLAEAIAESLQQANPEIKAVTRNSLDRINSIRIYVDLQITKAIQAIKTIN